MQAKSIRLLLILLSLVMLADYYSPNINHGKLTHNGYLSTKKINQLKMVVRRGDLIFRQGTASESYLISKLSGSSVSHVGVITQVTPTIEIVHATTDDDPNQLNQVIKSSISQFTHPYLSNQWIIYRLPISETDAENLANEVISQIGRPFELGVKGESGLYCTTIIANSLPDKITNQLKWQAIDIPGLKGEVLYPNSFLEIPGIVLLAES